VVAVGKRGAVRRKAEHTSEPEHWFTITAIMRSGFSLHIGTRQHQKRGRKAHPCA